MLCQKCGYENPDSATFCSQCGTNLAPDQPADSTPTTAKVITKNEYFASLCSDRAKKNNVIIRVLVGISLGIQGLLSLLTIVVLIAFSYALSKNELLSSGADVVMDLVPMILFWAVGSFSFTFLGIKKHSTGFFIASIFFAIIAVIMGSIGLSNTSASRLLALGTLVAYIVIIVLNCQNNKEYKNYLTKNQ